jgi:hypothetical protein
MIGIYVKIPGLSARDLVGFPFAGLLLAPIQRALMVEKLLVLPANASEFNAKVPQEAARWGQVFKEDAALLAAVKEAVNKLKERLASENKPYLTAEDVSQNECLRQEIERAESLIAKHSAKDAAREAALKGLYPQLKQTLDGICIFAYPCEKGLLLSALVSDEARALVVVKDELERLHLLAFSEIANDDQGRDVWRHFYPHNCSQPFDRHFGQPPDGLNGRGLR